MSGKSSEERAFQRFWDYTKIFGEPSEYQGKRGAMGHPYRFVINKDGEDKGVIGRLFWPMEILDQLYMRGEFNVQGVSPANPG